MLVNLCPLYLPDYSRLLRFVFPLFFLSDDMLVGSHFFKLYVDVVGQEFDNKYES